MTARRRIPSPATAISLVALFVALGGTGYAATRIASSARTTHAPAKPLSTTQVDAIVRKLAPTLSVKAAKSAQTATTAKNATNATTAQTAKIASEATNATNALDSGSATSAQSAQTATSATSATTAGTATNSSQLGGQPASAYLTTSQRVGTPGIVKVTVNAAPVVLVSSGPFTLSMVCFTPSGGSGTALELQASSSMAGSDLGGQFPGGANPAADVGNEGAAFSYLGSTPGATGDIEATTGQVATTNFSIDMEAPSGSNPSLIVSGATGVNSLGTSCWANLSGLR
jgi:hypothetical protein